MQGTGEAPHPTRFAGHLPLRGEGFWRDGGRIISAPTGDAGGDHLIRPAARATIRGCRPAYAENSPLDCFPGAAAPLKGKAFGGVMMSEDRKAEARQRYVTGTESLAAIGKALGISENTMGKWCREGKWVQERKKFQKRAARKAINKAVDKKAKELARLLEASECMESALVKAARAFDSDMDRNSAKFANGQMRGRNIESLSKAIRAQLDTRMLISGIMSAADREKIELMKRKQELEERKEQQEREQEAGGVKIVMDRDVEELAE